MPLAVYVRLQTDLDAAVALSVVLVAVAFALLLGLQLAPVMPFWKRADAGR
jgi:molybdate transport system permease protein